MRNTIVGFDFHQCSRAFDARLDGNFDALARECIHGFVVDARRFKLIQPARAIVQHNGCDVGHRQQRLEFIVPRQGAVHVVNALRQAHAHRGNVCGLQIVRVRQRQQRGDHRLH